jgi:hypothetical protein
MNLHDTYDLLLHSANRDTIMNTRTTLVLMAAVALTLLTASPADAQTQLLRQVIGSGATAAIGPQHAIAGTIGQTIIGRSTSSTHTGYLGFWYTYPNPNNPNAVREEYSSAVAGLAASMRVAPNPVVENATITVSLPTNGQVNLSLYSSVGEHRMTLIDGQRFRGTTTVQIPATDLESGYYTLVLQTSTGRVTSSLRVVK